MAGGGRRVETYYARGMLEIRTSLHLAVRVAVRVNQLLQHSGAASEGTGLWRAALPAFLVLDVVVWLVLRRNDRFGLSWRLPLDAADAAFWTASPLPENGSYDWAVLIAVPLAIETGVRVGWSGLVVPAGLLLSTGAAAAAAGKPISPIGVGWIVLCVAFGAAVFRYCRHLDQRAELEHQRVLGAMRRRAFLAGQNDVAMGASSAVDAIEGLVPVLGRPQAGSALWRLADGWKSQLSAFTSQEAKYLQVALLEWERLHNRHPDLSGLVEVRLEEGQGTTLLTAGQVRHLARSLDDLHLHGTVAVRLVDHDAVRLPGQALRLDVDGRTMLVRSDPGAKPPPFDPCAVTYVYMVVLCMAATLEPLGDMPLPAATAGGLTCVVAGLVSHRWIVTRGERARLRVFLLAVAVGTVLTLLTAFHEQPVTTDGEPLLGFGISLLLLSFLGGFYWRSLAGMRWILPAAVVGNLVLGLLVYPVPSPISARSVVASLAYNLFPLFPCRHLALALERAGGRHNASLEALDEGAVRAAFLAGRESVVGLVREAREDALRQLERLEPRLDAQIAELAANRLEEVDRRLRGIEAQGASSSSTTTS